LKIGPHLEEVLVEAQGQAAALVLLRNSVRSVLDKVEQRGSRERVWAGIVVLASACSGREPIRALTAVVVLLEITDVPLAQLRWSGCSSVVCAVLGRHLLSCGGVCPTAAVARLLQHRAIVEVRSRRCLIGVRVQELD